MQRPYHNGSAMSLGRPIPTDALGERHRTTRAPDQGARPRSIPKSLTRLGKPRRRGTSGAVAFPDTASEEGRSVVAAWTAKAF